MMKPTDTLHIRKNPPKVAGAYQAYAIQYSCHLMPYAQFPWFSRPDARMHLHGCRPAHPTVSTQETALKLDRKNLQAPPLDGAWRFRSRDT